MTPERAREIARNLVEIDVNGIAYIEVITAAILAAVAEEREVCAQIAETDSSFMMLQDFGLQSVVTQNGDNIALAIRARGSGAPKVDCVHEFIQKLIGKQLREYKCKLCGYTYEEDSSG